MAAPATQQSGAPATRSPRSTAKLVGVALVAVYAILLVVLNTDSVKISFVFFTAETSLLVALLLAGALGFVGGVLAHRARTRR